MIEHYSNKIQNIIQRELFKAKKSIKIAVAWFTNDLLFQPLLLKLQQGVKIEIILNHDDINNNNSNDINFDEFVSLGGILHWNKTDRLMHDKFCIIDDSIVMFGTYNWTNKAEYNEESMTAARDEKSTLEFYSKKFEGLCQKYPSIAQDHLNEISTKNIQVNFERKIIKPIKQEPYLCLNFYDEVFIDHSCPDGLDYFFAGIGKDSNYRQYCLIDPENFLPITDFLFEEYLLLNSHSNNNIWLKIGLLWGLYNISKRNFILEPQFESVDYGKYEDTRIFTVEKFGYKGTIDNFGRIHIPCIYSDIWVCTEWFIELEKNGKKGVWTDGEIVLPCEYEKLDTDGKYPSKKGNKYGIIKGTSIILPFEYDEIKYWEPFGCGVHYLCKNGKWGAHIVKTGQIIPCKYNSINDIPNFSLN